MYDVVIIGAGVIGCAIARKLAQYKVRVAVLEAGVDVAMGASRANSAIVHAGYDCEPGTNMARVNVKGNALFDQWCEELSVPLKRIGSIVAAFSEEEMQSVHKLYDYGIKNGVPGMEVLDKEKTLEIQPGLADNVLGCPAALSRLLDKLGSGDLAYGAELGSGVTLMNITTNRANVLLHNFFLQ